MQLPWISRKEHLRLMQELSDMKDAKCIAAINSVFREIDKPNKISTKSNDETTLLQRAIAARQGDNHDGL